MFELLQFVLNDDEIKELFGNHIYTNMSDYLGDCMIYSFHTITSDNITEHVRLQFTIITTTMDKSLRAEEALKRCLLTFADESKTNTIKQVALNGGGVLYDANRNKTHRVCYFDILKRRSDY